MADPTPEEVYAALAVLAAAETAREKAAETEHVTEQATASHVPVASEPVSPAAPVDPYLARSVKSSPNGF